MEDIISGVAGGSRIKREEVADTVANFKSQILDQYKYFSGDMNDIVISGSYQSDLSRKDFGDIDLIINFESPLSKKELKLDFVKWMMSTRKNLIRPFESEKYAGRYYSNTGELVSILFPIAHSDRAAQIDIIFSMDAVELNFKKEFLNLPAEKQGLVLGLTKVIFLKEDNVRKVFGMLNIPYEPLEDPNQEYEMTLSSVSLTVEIITYKDKVNYKILNKEVLKRITDWDTILRILELEIKGIAHVSFQDLLDMIKNKDWKNDRALKRIAGTFKSMISIKSGEVGTPKGFKKQEALDQIETLISEDIFNSYLKKVYM